MNLGNQLHQVLGERLLLTIILAGTTALFAWGLSIPIGIYTAVRQHKPEDYIFTFLGFLGLAIPDFLLALWLMWISFAYFNTSISGLFSPEYLNEPCTFDRVQDLFKHLWIAALVVGTAGTAALIRVMRANLLDELNKPYVITNRAKDLPRMESHNEIFRQNSHESVSKYIRLFTSFFIIRKHHCVCCFESADRRTFVTQGVVDRRSIYICVDSFSFGSNDSYWNIHIRCIARYS